MISKHVIRCMETNCDRHFGLLHRKHTCTGCGWIFCKTHVYTKAAQCGSCLRWRKEGRPPRQVPEDLLLSDKRSPQPPVSVPPRPSPASPPDAEGSRFRTLLPLLMVSGLLSSLTSMYVPPERSVAAAVLSILLSVWTTWRQKSPPGHRTKKGVEEELQAQYGKNRLVSPKFREVVEREFVGSPGGTPGSAIEAARRAVAANPDSEESSSARLERLQGAECASGVPLKQLSGSVKELEHWVDSKLGQVDLLHKDDKLFLAWSEYERMLSALAHLQLPEAPPTSRRQAAALWEEALASQRFQILRAKVNQSNRFLAQLERNDGWKLIRESSAGTKTLFRKELNSELYSFKVTGTVTGDLVRIIAVLYETDLYPQWFPFMKHSVELGRPSRFRKQFLLQLWFPWPFQNRDLLLDGYGVDMMEQNQAIINVSSIPPEADLYKQNPSGKGYLRGVMPLGGFFIKLLGKDKVAVTLMFNLDMNLPLSPSMINFFSGKLIHILLGRIQSASHRRIYDNRIEANPDVYGYIAETLRSHFKTNKSTS